MTSIANPAAICMPGTEFPSFDLGAEFSDRGFGAFPGESGTLSHPTGDHARAHPA
jgi:hypothetical protein